MACNLISFDWNAPLLPQVASYLVQKYEQVEQIDMLNVVCVLPGQRAIRRFFELLVTQSAKKDKALIPPTIIPQGLLPETLCNTPSIYVSSLQQQKIWYQIIQNNKETAEVLQTTDQDQPSSQLAQDLAALWETVGTAGKTFQILASEIEKLALHDEAIERWKTLAVLESHYRATLESLGLLDRTIQRESLLSDIKPSTKTFYLVGTIDLAPEVFPFLDAYLDSIYACIPSSEHLSDGFSPYGTIRHQFWLNRWEQGTAHTPEIVSATDPLSEAALIAKEITSQNEEDEVAVGIVDESLAPFLTETLTANGISFHSAFSVSQEVKELIHFFSSLKKLLQENTYHTMTELLRSPLAESLLSIEMNLTLIDQFGEERCPHTIFPLSKKTIPVTPPPLLAILKQVDQILELFQRERIISEWYTVLESWLENQSESFEKEYRELLMVAIHETLNGLLPTEGAQELELSCMELIDELILQLERQSGAYAQTQDSNGIEVIGWLELFLDDSSNVALMGLHDDVLPSGRSEDVWLPDSLKSTLGLASNEQRLSRDLFLLEHLMASRKKVFATFAKQNANGDFTKPSRLCMNFNPENLTRQIRDTYLHPGHRKRLKLFGSDIGTTKSWSYQPELPKGLNINELAITSFKDYIACPFRFYLTHILKLRTQENHPHELMASTYGTIVHAVLQKFGESSIAESKDENEIRQFLHETLDTHQQRYFSDITAPAVTMQMLYLKNRFNAFAQIQADWRNEGWKILHTEFPLPSRATKIAHNNGEMFLRGRIDRIDKHDKTGTLIALDYKTTAEAYGPEYHFDQFSESWRDLQLPLYKEALQQLHPGTDISTGYIVLPAEGMNTAILPSNWSEEEHTSAIQAASQVAEEISKDVFWPPTDSTELYFDNYSDLLGYGQYGNLESE